MHRFCQNQISWFQVWKGETKAVYPVKIQVSVIKIALFISSANTFYCVIMLLLHLADAVVCLHLSFLLILIMESSPYPSVVNEAY